MGGDKIVWVGEPTCLGQACIIIYVLSIVVDKVTYDLKKKLVIEILPCALTWMDLEGTVLSENQPEKEEYLMISLTPGI